MSPTIFTHLAAALIAAALTWTYQGAKIDAAVADAKAKASQVKAEAADAMTEAVKNARTEERAVAKTYQEALNAARTRESLLRAELDGLRLANDSLRDQSATAARLLAAAPPAAVLEYATAVGELLGDCRAAYAGVVEKADGHASDVRTHREAWPKGVSP